MKKNMDILIGWIGEMKTIFYLWLSLRNKSYRKFNNIILPSANGTTQIDHLIISIFGLFIVETKNKRGWIFGSEKEPMWTQSIYGKKYSFQNPLKQVYRQKKVLSEFLELNESKIHTVIYFVGDCRFKTNMPDNVIKTGIGRCIKRFQNQVLSIEDVDKINIVLSKFVNESSISKKDHVRSLQARHSSITICPRCGSNLVERTSIRGYYSGNKFLGCENYPKCRFTKTV